MKLSDLHENFYADQESQHLMDMIEDYLLSHNHKLKVHRAVDGLEEDQLEKLKGILYNAAQDSYDYATDTGGEINIPEEDIVQALQQMGAL